MFKNLSKIRQTNSNHLISFISWNSYNFTGKLIKAIVIARFFKELESSNKRISFGLIASCSYAVIANTFNTYLSETFLFYSMNRKHLLKILSFNGTITTSL